MASCAEQAILCRSHIRPVTERVKLEALAKVVTEKKCPAILGGNAVVSEMSVFAAEPAEVFEFCLHQSNPFERLEAFLEKYQLKETSCKNKGFCGGWIGYFGYELGRFIERLPGRAVDDIGLPVIRLGFYDKAILYDHQQNFFIIVAVEMEGGESVETKFALLNEWLDEAKAQPVSRSQSCSMEMEMVDPAAMHSTMTKTGYFAALNQIHRHIIDGDVYQINYSQRFSTAFKAKAIELFNWQNRYNPSPFAAYLAWADTAVVSTSPELYLDVRGDAIVTRPIKGTRPRNAALPENAAANRDQFTALVESEKEQAELAMIVDLERNDLARVCVPGTRHVPCARRIEAFATVYHAVGTVAGTLAASPGPGRIETILRATFPGGSITGAPKIRAMEIIDALEPTGRGVYTGGIGWIGLDYDLCLNIAIRTVVVHKNTAYVQVGGGIVVESEPQAEWDETLTKARALLAGIRAVNGRIHI